MDTKTVTIISAAATFLLLGYLEEDEDEPRIPVRAASKRRYRPSFQTITTGLNDVEFRRAFRISRPSFDKLVCMLHCHLIRDAERASRSSGGAISPSLRLAITLRLLSGGSYLDQMISFHVGRSTVFAVFKETVLAIMKVLKMPGVPLTNFEKLLQLANDFQNSRVCPSPIRGCIAAIDGIAIGIQKPPDEYMPRNFFCRKGKFALPVQACVDSNYRFLTMSCVCVGSTHDSVAFSVSGLANELRNGTSHHGFWIAGDAAYSGSDGIVTPWSASALRDEDDGLYRDAFNYYHSSYRIHVEQAFGMLVRRWGVLWKPLSYRLVDSLPILSVCMRLHNFAVDEDGIQATAISDFERVASENATRSWLNSSQDLLRSITESGQGRRTDLLVSSIREQLTNQLKQHGIVRPASS
eukprot:IDg2445t1